MSVTASGQDPSGSDVTFWPPAAVVALQQERWQTQRDYVVAQSAFYRRLWEGRPPPVRVEALAEALPPTTKAALRESQAALPPFGDYLAAPPERVNRLHRTSGTTGRPMNTALSAADARQTAEVGGRANRLAGLVPGMMVVHCLNYQLWMGGVTDHMTLEATGATVVPFGVGGSELLIRTIRELGVAAIYCTPSYPAVLERVIAERFPGLAPRDLGLRLGLLTGEPGLENPAFRARVEGTWGFRARNVFGISDVLTTIAAQCAEDENLHFVAGDVLYPELLDPATGEPLAWREGAAGELVLTHLARECQPLVRFRTGDVVELTGIERCRCGRWAPRYRARGRSDDMVIVRGVNVFPTAVAAVLNRFPELSGEFRVLLRGPGPYDRLPVEAELAPGQEATPRLVAAVEAEIKAATRASAAVILQPAMSLPRSEGKTRRVVREEPTA